MRALACLLAIAFATAGITAHARAQAPDRGYGGPETVGPNFSTGKQSVPPDYGNGPPKQKSYSKPQPPKKAAKPAKPEVKAARKPAPKPDPVAKTEPATTDAATKDTAATPATETSPGGDSATSTAKTQTCRRFDATTSTTLEVPCD
jgi:outer membrane biosynthesis protein TonB